MANARAIVKRRKAVGNIRKITRTMQLIATARYQASLKRAMATKPYTQKITELVAQLSRGAEGLDHPLLKVHPEPKRAALIVMTSNRGMCGGYNASLLRECSSALRDNEAAGLQTDLHMVGKKGINYFDFIGQPMTAQYEQFEDKPQFAEVEPIAVGLMDAYERGEIDKVEVVYMRFISTAKQSVERLQLLPIEKPELEEGASAVSVQYEFMPDPVTLLKTLLPETVKVQLFQCFTDMAVSEQVSRMIAMKSATDAAGDMVKLLSRQYNRARQSQITLELLDIVGGANALEK